MIFLYFKSYVTKLDAISINPLLSFKILYILLPIVLDEITSRGKNVTLPSAFCFKYVIASSAHSVFSVTTYEDEYPSDTSIAFVYLSVVFTILPIASQIPFNLGLFKTDFTAKGKPLLLSIEFSNIDILYSLLTFILLFLLYSLDRLFLFILIRRLKHFFASSILPDSASNLPNSSKA